MNRNATCGFVLFTAIAVLSPPAAARLSPVFQDTGQISVYGRMVMATTTPRLVALSR